MNRLLIAGIILAIIAAALGLHEWWCDREGKDGFFERVHTSAFVIFVAFGLFWYLGNIEFGNNAAWQIGIDWLEARNGDATLKPWLTNPITASVINFLPSIGQWWRWRFEPKGSNSTASYALSTIDWSMNTVGFYTAYAPFTGSIHWGIFIGMAVAAYFPNFWSQGVCQNAWALLALDFEQYTLPKKKKKRFIPTLEELLK